MGQPNKQVHKGEEQGTGVRIDGELVRERGEFSQEMLTMQLIMIINVEFNGCFQRQLMI